MLGLFGKRKATQVLGLDISSTTVKLLELSYTGGRYRVESYAVSSLPQDAVIEKSVNDVDGVSNAIRAVVAQSRTKLKNVAAAVAGSSVITKLIDMPMGLSEDDMEIQLTGLIGLLGTDDCARSTRELDAGGGPVHSLSTGRGRDRFRGPGAGAGS